MKKPVFTYPPATVTQFGEQDIYNKVMHPNVSILDFATAEITDNAPKNVYYCHDTRGEEERTFNPPEQDAQRKLIFNADSPTEILIIKDETCNYALNVYAGATFLLTIGATDTLAKVYVDGEIGEVIQPGASERATSTELGVLSTNVGTHAVQIGLISNALSPLQSNVGAILEATKRPTLSTEDKIEAFDEDPKCDIYSSSPLCPERAIIKSNWSVDPGNTVLVFDSVECLGDEYNGYYLQFIFTGTAAPGTILIRASHEVFKNLDLPSKVLNINVT